MTSGAFLQSKAWGEFQTSLGRRVERLSGEGWSAQLMKTRLPLGQSYWSCSKGPVGDAGKAIEALVVFGASHGAAFLRVEPAVVPADAIKTLDVQPADTLVTDLTRAEEALLVAMHQKTRYNIRVAQKRGVEIRFDDTLDVAWSVFQETAARDGFRLHPRPHYEAMLASLKGECRAFLATARLDGRVLAANLLIDFEGTRTYLHGASSNADRNAMAPYLLHWESMCDAKAKGLAAYDWWGVAPEGSPKEKSWAGITRFKRGFGGEEVRSLGTFDLPIAAWKYAAYRLARRFVR